MLTIWCCATSCCCRCSCWGTGELIRHPSQSQMGGCVVKIPLVRSNFILLPQCLIDLFQSLAVSRPDIYWNSFGVIQASWNQIQGPLEPWQSLDKYISALFVPHSISNTTSSSRTWNEGKCYFEILWGFLSKNSCCNKKQFKYHVIKILVVFDHFF